MNNTIQLNFNDKTVQHKDFSHIMPLYLIKSPGLSAETAPTCMMWWVSCKNAGAGVTLTTRNNNKMYVSTYNRNLN